MKGAHAAHTRSLPVLIAALVLVSGFPFPGAGASHAAVPAVAEQFNYAFSGSALHGISPWTESAAGGVWCFDAFFVNVYNYCMVPSGPDFRVEYGQPFGNPPTFVKRSGLTDAFSGSLRVNLTSTLSTETSAGVLLQDSAGGVVSPANGNVYVYLGSAGRVFARNGGVDVVVGTYAANQKVTIDIDFRPGAYDVCVNGVRGGLNLAYGGVPIPNGLDTASLWAGSNAFRTATATWDDLLYVPTPQDFCLDPPGPSIEPLSDRDLRMLTVDAFYHCVIDAAFDFFNPFFPHCPFSRKEIEVFIIKTLEGLKGDGGPGEGGIPTPTLVAPGAIPAPERPATEFVPLPFADCCQPRPVPGPDLPAVPRVPLVAGPELPAVPRVPLVEGPALPKAPVVPLVPGPDFTVPPLPAFKAEPVVVSPPDMRSEPAIIPLRDQPLEVDWHVSFGPGKVRELLPSLAALTSALDGTMAPPAQTEERARWEPERAALLAQVRPFLAQHALALQAQPDAPAPPVPELPAPLRGLLTAGQDAIDDLAGLTGVELRVPDDRPPLLYEVHTESRGVVKRTLAVALVPSIIDVDDNPTTGLLGFDVVVAMVVTPMLDQFSMNVLRLQPLERNLPGLGEQLPELPPPLDPFPSPPLDLTIYALVPLNLLMPVETALARNPDAVGIASLGYTTQGNDAPLLASIGLKADSFLPPHPNSRYTFSLDTMGALDNFTLLGGFADGVRTGPDECVATTAPQCLTDALAELRGALGLALLPPDPQHLVDTTAFRLGYRYDAENATLLTLSFQPPPEHLTVDAALQTEQPDANIVVRLASEADTDTRLVLTEERGLLGPTPVRDIANFRADKLPHDVTITFHDDPTGPATSLNYKADRSIGRIHALAAEDVRFGAPGAPRVHFDTGPGTAASVTHLNVSDLPPELSLVLSNGSDLRMSAAAPIGRIAIVAAEGATPAFVAEHDGLLVEQRSASSRFGAVLRGLQDFKVLASEPVRTVRWQVLGDQAFLVNITQGEPGDEVRVRTVISNLPRALGFSTDGSSFFQLETSDELRSIASYVASEGAGFAARADLEGLPQTLAGRFDFDAGELRVDVGAPVRRIDVLARMAGGDPFRSASLHVEDLPSFQVAWDENGASFDAGAGIGRLRFLAGGDVLLHAPALDGGDHAFFVQGMHPLAPLAVGAQMDGLKFVSVASAGDSLAARLEHRRPAPFRLVASASGLEAQAAVEDVPGALALRFAPNDGNLTATYEASEVIDRITAAGRLAGLEWRLLVEDIPTRIDLELAQDGGAMTAQLLSSGRLTALEAQVRDLGGLFGSPLRRAYARVEGVPEQVTLRLDGASGGEFRAAPGVLDLVEAAVSTGPLVMVPDVNHVYVDEGAGTLQASARIRELRFAGATFDGDGLTARFETERPRPFLAAATLASLGFRGVLSIQDLPATVSVASNLVDRHVYEASEVIRDLDAYAQLGSLEGWLSLRDVPARIAVDVGAEGDATTATITASSRLASLVAQLHDPAGILGTPFQRAYARVEGLPQQVTLRIASDGGEFRVTPDVLDLVEAAVSSGPTLFVVPDVNHAYFDAGGKALTIASARLRELRFASADFSSGALSARLETERPRPFLAAATLPSMGFQGVLSIQDLPATVSVASNLADRHVYEASGVIAALDAYASIGSLQGWLSLRDIPARVAVTLGGEGNTTTATILSSSRLASLEAQLYDPAGILGTPFQRAYARVEGLPQQVTLRIASDGGEFRVTPDVLDLVEAAVSSGPTLAMVPEINHVYFDEGIAQKSPTLASARIRELRYASAEFGNASLEARFETERPRPFLAAASLPSMGFAGVLSIRDLPATVSVSSNLADRHVYEASGVIADLDAYARIGSLQGWLSIQDLPARIAVTLGTEDDATTATIASSSRTQSITAHLSDSTGILGSDWQRAYARVEGLPEVLTVRVAADGAEFGTEHDLVALIEGAASTTDTLVMLPDDHLLYAVLGDRGCGPQREVGGSQSLVSGGQAIVDGDPKVECPTGNLTSFRLHGLGGMRAHYNDAGFGARLETRDHRNFTAFVQQPGLRVCAFLDALPTVVDVQSDLKSEHIYDASSIVEKLQLLGQLGTTNVFLDVRDIPTHMHVQHELVEGGTGTVRMWTSSPLRDIVADAWDFSGLGDAKELQRARLHVRDLPAFLEAEFSPAGVRLTTDGAGIGLVEGGVSGTTGLEALTENGFVYEEQPSILGIARLTGFQGASFRESAGEVDAELHLRDAAPFTGWVRTPDILAYGRIDPVPEDVSIHVDPKGNVVYAASRPIEEVIAYIAQPTKLGDRVARAEVHTIPAVMRIAFDEELGVVHLDSSEAIGRILLNVTDPAGDAGIGFTHAFVDIHHVPAEVRLRFKDVFQADFSEGVDLVEFGATATGTYPTFAGPHVSVRKLAVLGAEALSVSARVEGLKFAELFSNEGFTSGALRFRESHPLTAHYEEIGSGGFEKQYHAELSNVPKDIEFQLVTSKSLGSLVYEASERIGSLELLAEDDDLDDLVLTLQDLPSKLNVEWKTDDVPIYVRYIADAPTTAEFSLQTDNGPVAVSALVQNIQFTLLRKPGLSVSVEVSFDFFPPAIHVNLVLAVTATIGLDTDFVPNTAKAHIGLVHEPDTDVALILDGKIMTQDFLMRPGIELRLGTDTGLTFPINPLGGVAFLDICVGGLVRYDPLGINYEDPCIIHKDHPEP